MIEMRDAMRAVLRHRKGDIVVSTETSIGAWDDVTDDETLDLPIPAMSKGSSMALGVAIAQPHRRVILWDGDGSLLMKLGSVVTVAGQAPANFYHVVLDNGVYAMTGGQPVPNQGGLSYRGLAEAAGYAKTFEFDDLEEWTTQIGEVLNEPDPVLIVMKTVPELTDWRNNPPPNDRGRTGGESRADERRLTVSGRHGPTVAAPYMSPSSEAKGLRFAVTSGVARNPDALRPIPTTPRFFAALQNDKRLVGYDPALADGGHTFAFGLPVIPPISCQPRADLRVSRLPLTSIRR